MASIKEILKVLEEVSERKGISRPYICGGVPRDKYLGRPEIINDLDITTGDESIHQLAKDFSEFYPVQGFKILKDGHAQVTVDRFKIDFSSNFRAPGIEQILTQSGVEKPTGMLMELMSRDFTCNAMLLSPDLQTIKDPTGLGVKDIDKRLLRTCLPARLTLGNDSKRVVRVLYLAAKLHFDVDPEIIKWVSENPQTISAVKPKYLSDKLQQALNFDTEKTVQLLDAMGLWKHIPILPDLMPYASASAGRM